MEERTLELTKEQAIAEHRKMWNWIAEEILKRKDIVTKEDYFREHNIMSHPFCNCWCCEYCDMDCTKCPVVWPGAESCTFVETPFYKWVSLTHPRINMHSKYREAAAYAKIIANLPEREET